MPDLVITNHRYIPIRRLHVLTVENLECAGTRQIINARGPRQPTQDSFTIVSLKNPGQPATHFRIKNGKKPMPTISAKLVQMITDRD